MDGRVNGNRSTFGVRRSAFTVRRSPFVVRRSIWLAGLIVALALSFVRTASAQLPRLRSLPDPASYGAARQSAEGATAAASTELPELTAPVNDFAKVIDADSADAMDR